MDYNQESTREFHTLPILSKTVSIIVIVREPITLLNAWLTQENADFLHPLTDAQNNLIYKIYIFGISLLVSAIIFLKNRTHWSLGIISLIFLVESFYQLTHVFFEAFYFITSPLIFIFLCVIWVYSPTKEKTADDSSKSQ